MRSQKFKDESGSAPLEFIGFGLVLQLPLIPLVLQLNAVQLEQFTAESIARNALRAYTVSSVPIESSIEIIATDFHLPQTTKITHSLQQNGNKWLLEVSVGSARSYAEAVAP